MFENSLIALSEKSRKRSRRWYSDPQSPPKTIPARNGAKPIGARIVAKTVCTDRAAVFFAPDSSLTSSGWARLNAAAERAANVRKRGNRRRLSSVGAIPRTGIAPSM